MEKRNLGFHTWCWYASQLVGGDLAFILQQLQCQSQEDQCVVVFTKQSINDMFRSSVSYLTTAIHPSNTFTLTSLMASFDVNKTKTQSPSKNGWSTKRINHQILYNLSIR